MVKGWCFPILGNLFEGDIGYMFFDVHSYVGKIYQAFKTPSDRLKKTAFQRNDQQKQLVGS